MRSHQADAGPAAVSKYLLPREVQVFSIRRHPAALAPYAFEAFGGFLAAVVLNATLARSVSMKLIVWIGAGLLAGQLLWALATWSVGYLVMTSQRLITVSGLIKRRVTMIPVSDLTDMGFERSGPGRRLGYGAFILEVRGRRAVYNCIPYPEQLYLLVCSALFPERPEEPLDEI